MAAELKSLILNKENGICGEFDNCAVLLYESEDKLNNYLNSNEYSQYNRFISTAIIVEESKDSFWFHIKTNMKEPYTIDYSLDKFNIIPISDYYPQTYLQSLHHLLGYYKLQKISETHKILNDRKLIIRTIPLKSPHVLNSNVDTEALLSFVITFSASFIFMPITIKLSLYLMSENETRQKQLLRKQGVSLVLYQLSWYIYIMIEILIPIVLISMILQLFFFPYINLFYIFLCFFMLVIDIISISLFISQFFATQKSGQIAFKIFYIGTTLFSTLISRTDSRLAYKMIFSFIPFVPFNSAILTLFESRHFKNGIYKDIFFTFNNGNSFIICLTTMLVNSFIFFGFSILLSYYYELNIGFFDCFFLKKRREIDSENNSEEALISEPAVSSSIKSQKENNETLQIIDLCVSRVTNDIEFKIKNFNLELFKNEIYILVGENGSGKSTLIKALSQEIYSDSGQVLIDNKNILLDRSHLYKIMGLNCQENILFDHMTVLEHIVMIDNLKSDTAMSKQEINDLINILGIAEFKNSYANELSEGVKRKLCVAIAMVGNSKVVLLDEPTSGVDIFSRRELWNFLLKYKNDRIIIISTHSLEEAEYLGDRIGIIKDGKLICSGSPAYLKEVYSIGLNIKFLFKEGIPKKYKLAFIRKINTEPYANFITIKSMSKDSVIINFYGFPGDFNFKQLFQSYDETKLEFNIQEYTIFTTSLEDVVSQVYLMNEEKIERSSLISIQNINNNNTFDFTRENETIHEFPVISRKLVKKRNFAECLQKNLKKNLLILSRSKSLLFFELISSLFPLFFYILSVYKYTDLTQLIDPITLIKRTDTIPFNQYFNSLDSSDYIIDPNAYFSETRQNFKPAIGNTYICNNLNISKFDDDVYQNFRLQSKSAIYVTQNNYNIFEVYAFYSANSIDLKIADLL